METSQVYKADPMLISIFQVGKVRLKKINFSNVTQLRDQRNKGLKPGSNFISIPFYFSNVLYLVML